MDIDTVHTRSHAVATMSGGRRAMLGIGFSVVGILFFTVAESFAKHLGKAGYPAVQLVFLRNIFALLPTLLMIWYVDGFKNMTLRRPLPYILRAILGALSLVCFFYALARMPLADVTALSFAAPIFTMALAPFLLKEPSRLGRWLAVIVGFFGVIIILRPSADVIANSTALIVLLAALCGSLSLIITRRLGTTEPFGAMIFYVAIFTLLVSILFLPFSRWTPVETPTDWAMIAGGGLISGAAGIFLVIAYRLAPAAVIAPFDYTAILFAIVIGFLFFSELPDATTLVGATIVIGSGIYAIYLQQRQQQ